MHTYELRGVKDLYQTTYNYITYSFNDGLSIALKTVTIAITFSIICMIVTYVIYGLRKKLGKKECLIVLTTSIIVKTIVVFLWISILAYGYYNITHRPELIVFIAIIFFGIPAIGICTVFEAIILYRARIKE